MKPSAIVISGTVLDRRAHRPIADAVVEALISRSEKPVPFKKGTTDESGVFRFETSDAEWKRAAGDYSEAFAFFRVSVGDPPSVLETRDSLRWRPETFLAPVQLFVDRVAPSRLTGMVVDARDRSVANVSVVARVIEGDATGLTLGSSTTDDAGRYGIEFPSEVFESRTARLNIELVVGSDPPLRRVLVRSAVEGIRAGTHTHDIHLPPAPDSLATLNDTLREPITGRLLERLATARLDTVSALRSAGGVPRTLGGDAHRRDIDRLNAIASLSLIDAPLPVLSALADANIPSVLDLARLTPDDVKTLLDDTVPRTEVVRYLARAGRASNEISNRIMQKRLDPDTPGNVTDEFSSLFRLTCHCECAAVTSPQAYLAQLLRFALQVIRYNGAAIDIAFLQDRFRQPLRDLPATCASAEHTLAQVRIAVEVLRKDLAATGQAAAAISSPQWYREAAYLELLEFFDLRYDELRPFSTMAPQEKAEFIRSRGLGTGTPADALIFDEIFRDIGAPVISVATAVTEPWLASMFGLRSTLADPLDPDVADPLALVLRRDALRGGWIALDASTTRPFGGIPLVDPDLVEELDLVDRTVGTPNDLVGQWRPIDFLMRRRREMQSAESLIATDLTTNPALPLADRFKNLFLDLATAQSFIAGSAIPVPPFGFRDGGDTLDYPRMRQMRNALNAGQDVSADLTRFKISEADLRAIVMHVEALEQNLPVTADETFSVERIILAHVKRAGFWPTWLMQERTNAGQSGELALEPGKFRLRSRDLTASDPVWQPRPWLANQSERNDWEDILRARTRMVEALRAELTNSVIDVETRLLPELRNQLIGITPPGSVYTKAKVDALTDRLQIDFVAGGCRRTTRVSQAIETVQGLLFGARNGLFNDAVWSIATSDFDAIWRWLGTYDTWSAAMLAFIFPEDLLRPSLRGNASPGFIRALTSMRDADPIGSPEAVSAYNTFASYLNDVVSLELLAGASRPITPVGQMRRDAVYLIGATVGRGARRFYWSVAIEQPDGAGDQSWWREIPSMSRSEDVLGAALCGTHVVALTMSTLATTRMIEVWRLPLPGNLTDEELLRDAPEWEGPFTLELPDGVNTFLSVTMSTGSSTSGPVITIEADETTIYTRVLDLGGKSWTGRFRMIQAQSQWRRLGQSDPYGITPANEATFACHNNGTLYSVPEPRFVMTGDVDGDGADELIALGGPDGFWSMKLIMVGARATWLPLGNRPASAKYDVILTSPNQRLYYSVTGDFDGDGIDEVAVMVDAPPQRGIYTSYLNVFVKKWNTAAAAWQSLGAAVDLVNGAQMYYPIPWFVPLGCAVGRFTQGQRDEIVIVYRDSRNAGNVTDIQVLGLVNGTWTLVLSSLVTEFSGNQRLGGTICAGRLVEGDRDQLLMQQIEGGMANGRFWTLQVDNGQWRSIATLDAGTLSGLLKLIAADFDADGVDEIACADNTPSVRFFKNESNGWTLAQTVTLPSRVDEWAEGDFGNTGGRYVIAKCVNDPLAGVPVHIDQNALLVVEQQPNFTLGSNVPARGIVGGRFSGSQQPSGLAALGDECTFYAQVKLSRSVSVSRPAIFKFKPHLTELYRLDRGGSTFRLVDPAFVAAASLRAFTDNQDNRPHNQAYLEEAYYFLIVEISLRLQAAANFATALDWLQLVARLEGNRLLPQSRFLALDAAGVLVDLAPVDLDPLDCHAVARRRAGTYGRFTTTTFVRLLTDYADSEFAFASSESLALARELYDSALALLDRLTSVFGPDGCNAAVAALINEVKAVPALALLVADLRALFELDDALRLNAVIWTIRDILANDRSTDQKISNIKAALEAAAAAPANHVQTFGERVEEEEATAQIAHLSVLPGVSIAILENQHFVDWIEILKDQWQLKRPVPLPQFSFCIPSFTQHAELRRRIELARERLSNCRDIAGNELVVLPVGGAPAASPASAPRGLQPLPYRYQTLVDRAKQLLEIARQLEATMLNYIEAAERKRYEVMNARRDLALANAAERLKAVQVEQAAQELGTAALQRDRAQDQVDKWSQLLRDGLNEWEIAGVAAQWVSFGLKQSAAIATTIKYAATPEGWVKDVITFGAEASASIATAQADAASAFAQAASTQADYERRAEMWSWNLRDSRRDVQIGNQQIVVATTRVQGALVEQQISSLQASFASQIVTTLTTANFTNEALYEWMAGVLEGIYRFFLQQATQLARLAEIQLAFERQQAIQGLIKRDYWSRMRSDSSPNVNSVSNSTDSLRGLTGAANLLRDLYQLDQLAFLKNQRKHQLTETVSLVRHDPLAFAQIARTGRIAFETPMSLFDSKLPGHYLRLVRRVRVSVIALIPPTMGIRATLSNAGVSRVVVPTANGYETTTLRRGYEEVVFTTPVNATGVFEMDAQPELRNAFEGSGTDTRWILELPRAANGFDFESLADILVTFEYTSLSDSTLREKVIAALPNRVGAERVFSLRNEFPDLWFDLANANSPGTAIETKLQLRRSDFPPNIEDIRTTQISVLVRFRTAAAPLDIDYVRFAPANTTTVLDGGPARLDGSGVVTTRRANGSGWLAIIAGAATFEPLGEWRLRFAAAALPMFKNQEIEDVLFTLAFEGRTPAWT